jgi:hypothetical protein
MQDPTPAATARIRKSPVAQHWQRVIDAVPVLKAAVDHDAQNGADVPETLAAIERAHYGDHVRVQPLYLLRAVPAESACGLGSFLHATQSLLAPAIPDGTFFSTCGLLLDARFRRLGSAIEKALFVEGTQCSVAIASVLLLGIDRHHQEGPPGHTRSRWVPMPIEAELALARPLSPQTFNTYDLCAVFGVELDRHGITACLAVREGDAWTFYHERKSPAATSLVDVLAWQHPLWPTLLVYTARCQTPSA